MRSKVPEWHAWEREFAREFGMNEVVASGGTDNYKGDCKGNAFLVDCKYTERKTYSLSFDMWEKVATWARNESHHPMLAVRTSLGDYIVMPEHVHRIITDEDLWDGSLKGQKSVAIGKQKQSKCYVLKDGCATLRLVVSPIDDVREAVVSYEQGE